MKSFLRRLLKIAAYTAAGVVITLAIAVGLFRLFLPRLPEYQEEIKGWASRAIGMEVEFSGMDARWGLSGPELEFYDAELVKPETSARVIAAEEVRVGVALTRLLVDRTLVVDRVVVSGTSIEVRQLEDGRWWVQGSPAESLVKTDTGDAQDLAAIEVVGEDIEIVFLQPGDERPRFFDVPRSVVSIDENRIAFDADIRLPDDLGGQLELSATQLLDVARPQRHWDITVDAANIDLAGWSDLQSNDAWKLRSGTGDLDVSLAYAEGRVSNAGAEVDLVDVAFQQDEPFDLDGRFEFNVSERGWLIAADELHLATPEREWPESRLRAEAGTEEDGSIVMLDVRATHLRLDDLSLIAPLLTVEHREMLADLDPDGNVLDLVAEFSDIGTESPGFDVDVVLDNAGIAASDVRPGVRGFSGRISGNRSGGRFEIQSTDMTAHWPEYLADPIEFDLAEGMVVWRSSDSRTTVLSDGIRISNDIIDSQSNVYLTIEGDGSSPVIDLASTWNVSDISLVKNYIPQKFVKEKLYDWFQTAFVQGSIPRGSTRFNGPLDKFPFDNDEGQFLIEATIRNFIFEYHPLWPQTEHSDMEVVLDNMRLYSVRNRGLNSGNRIVDARVDIADLRQPVLKLQAFATGTLETIRRFTSQSPIANVFGGQLERVTVSGDASLDLELTVPLLDPGSVDFTAQLRSNNGTLRVEGFDPEVTDLTGEITVRPDDVSSEALGATFLGEAVTVELGMSEDPRFSVVATTVGRAGAEAIVNDLGMPVDGLITGSMEYESKLLFPGRDEDTKQPFTIRVESDLLGLAIALPEPVGKTEESTLEVRGDIRFLDDGDTLESVGFTENRVAWQALFHQQEDHWDFDRGVVTTGSDVMHPAETRGLHVRGTTPIVRLDDWLDLSQSGEEESGFAERIRSIDLVVEDLFAIGQHLQEHHVRVDRSARDWLVQIEGEDVVGSVFVPYEFDTERAMVVEMQRLHLPGDDVSPEDTSILDPRTLPPVTLKAADFSLGARDFGTLDAEVIRVPEGLEATAITTKDDTFEIAATGRWLYDEADPLGSRTFTNGTLTSSDVETTMARLDFAPGIVSDEMNVNFDLSFSGGPRADFLDVLDGEVQVEFGAGQLEEVEPGAGRMFGLMSVTALPRRLSLDFKDVFNKGFGFDKIAGRFQIDDGEAYTCDLSFDGPAADIGIIGRASLAVRDYDQTAVVSANFGNTLPIAGLLVAGPQAAAALLIFSQIFKKPLQEVGQVYYTISGSWDDPALERSDSQSFAADSELAGCLTGTE